MKRRLLGLILLSVGLIAPQLHAGGMSLPAKVHSWVNTGNSTVYYYNGSTWSPSDPQTTIDSGVWSEMWAVYPSGQWDGETTWNTSESTWATSFADMVHYGKYNPGYESWNIVPDPMEFATLWGAGIDQGMWTDRYGESGVMTQQECVVGYLTGSMDISTAKVALADADSNMRMWIKLDTSITVLGSDDFPLWFSNFWDQEHKGAQTQQANAAFVIPSSVVTWQSKTGEVCTFLDGEWDVDPETLITPTSLVEMWVFAPIGSGAGWDICDGFTTAFNAAMQDVVVNDLNWVTRRAFNGAGQAVGVFLATGGATESSAQESIVGYTYGYMDYAQLAANLAYDGDDCFALVKVSSNAADYESVGEWPQDRLAFSKSGGASPCSTLSSSAIPRDREPFILSENPIAECIDVAVNNATPTMDWSKLGTYVHTYYFTGTDAERAAQYQTMLADSGDMVMVGIPQGITGYMNDPPTVMPPCFTCSLSAAAKAMLGGYWRDPSDQPGSGFGTGIVVDPTPTPLQLMVVEDYANKCTLFDRSYIELRPKTGLDISLNVIPPPGCVIVTWLGGSNLVWITFPAKAVYGLPPTTIPPIPPIPPDPPPAPPEPPFSPGDIVRDPTPPWEKCDWAGPHYRPWERSWNVLPPTNHEFWRPGGWGYGG